MNRIAAAASLVALAGCGNYSTEDLRFLAALPQREDLRVAVPSQRGSSAFTTMACPGGTADVWLWAKPTSDGLNSAVDFVLTLVDAVRRYPPSWREQDARGWGPFADEKHPGREIRIVMTRSYPPALAGAPRHDYRFEAHVEGTADPFLPIITGTFDGASASRGSGSVALHFDALWTLAMNDADTPHGTMQIGYDRASEPATVDLSLAQAGFGIVDFTYGFTGYRDGRGGFDYAFRNSAGDRLTVVAGFDAAGGGRAQVAAVTAGGLTGSFRQCWDSGACLVYVDDPGNFSCATPPCSGGNVAACPEVPASPF